MKSTFIGQKYNQKNIQANIVTDQKYDEKYFYRSNI